VLAEDRALYETSLERLLGSTGADRVIAELAELGWDDVVAGDPAAAWGMLMELKGRALCDAPLTDAVVLAELGRAGVAGLPGPEDTAVVYPLSTDVSAAVANGAALSVEGLVLGRPGGAGQWVVAGTTDGADGLFVIPASAGFELDARSGADPALRIAMVSASVPAGADWFSPWAQAPQLLVSIGRRAVAHELVGVCGQMLTQAVEHARSRVQFGYPIGSRQAIKNRLAETYVAVEAARTVAAQAWETGTALAGAQAKAMSAQAFTQSAGHCQQVLGGMGFTAEHPFCRLLARGLALQRVLGTESALQAEIGRRLCESGATTRMSWL
jgi:Acyl-CoA dehydrogenase, C-terminal domain